MIDINFLTTFLFIFTILVILKSIVEMVQSLLSNPPKPINMKWGYQVLLGLSISYTISFLIYII